MRSFILLVLISLVLFSFVDAELSRKARRTKKNRAQDKRKSASDAARDAKRAANVKVEKVKETVADVIIIYLILSHIRRLFQMHQSLLLLLLEFPIH